MDPVLFLASRKVRTPNVQAKISEDQFYERHNLGIINRFEAIFFKKVKATWTK